MEDCKPKIVSYFKEAKNINLEYNCELCDNTECPQWQEFNEKE